MSKQTVFRGLAVACIALLSVTGVFASNGYVGASAGSGSYDVSGYSASDTSFKVLGGWRAMKYFSVEGDYRDFGSADTTVGSETYSVGTTSLDLFAVGVIPIGQKFEVFGKAGYAMWDTEASISGFGSTSVDGNDLAYGAGVAWNFGKFGLRIEYEMFDLDYDVSLDMASVGMEFRF